MARSATREEFLSRTASIASSIVDSIDDVPGAAQPLPTVGAVPATDPLHPWRDIDVKLYVPLVEWAISKPFDMAAARFGRTDAERDLLKLDKGDRETIRPALKEVTQKCLYDLGAQWIANPYVAALLSIATLTAAKVAAVSVLRRNEEKSASTQNAPTPGAVFRPFQPQRQHPSPSVVPFPPNTQRDSSTMSGRAEASGDASLSAASPEAENLSYSLDELGDAAEL